MKKGLFLSLAIISLIVFIIWGGIRIVSGYDFKNNCGGYLNRATNANSVELAEQNLSKAIEYLERNDLTHGQVSIFLRQPKNDIEYWYSNLKSAQAQLQSVGENISVLEESNVLMKLRETLTDSGKKASVLVCPDGISVYPNNALYFWMSILSLLGVFIFGSLFLYEMDCGY